MNNIIARLKATPKLNVKVGPTGSVTPTNPFIIAPTTYDNASIDVGGAIEVVRIFANNVAANAYANAVTYVNNADLDGGTF